jgi:plastocyanin
MRKRSIRRLGLLGGLALLAATFGFNVLRASPARAASTATVTVETVNGTFAFVPSTLNITRGTTVTWKNATNAMHTVTSDAGRPSANLPVGGSVHFTFTKDGTFHYHCNIHPYMTGVVVVTG